MSRLGMNSQEGKEWTRVGASEKTKTALKVGDGEGGRAWIIV